MAKKTSLWASQLYDPSKDKNFDLYNSLYEVDDALEAGQKGIGMGTSTYQKTSKDTFGNFDTELMNVQESVSSQSQLDKSLSDTPTFSATNTGQSWTGTDLLSALNRYRQGKRSQQSARSAGFTGRNSVLGGGAF